MTKIWVKSLTQSNAVVSSVPIERLDRFCLPAAYDGFLIVVLQGY
jgi:hypothetical protein